MGVNEAQKERVTGTAAVGMGERMIEEVAGGEVTVEVAAEDITLESIAHTHHRGKLKYYLLNSRSWTRFYSS